MHKNSHKLTEEDVDHIVELLRIQSERKRLWREVSNPAIAEKFNVSTSTIEYIQRNKMRVYPK
jgi:hypothetical protein